MKRRGYYIGSLINFFGVILYLKSQLRIKLIHLEVRDCFVKGSEIQGSN